MFHTRTSVRIFYGLLSIVLLLAAWLFSAFLGPIVLALVLFVLFQRLNEWFARLLRGHRVAASIVTTILIVLIVVIPLSFLVVLLATQAHDFYLRTKDAPFINELIGLFKGDSMLAERVSKILAGIGIDFQPNALVRMAADALTKIALFFSERLSNLADLAGNVMTMALDFCVMVTVVYALFVYGDDLREFVSKSSPLPDEEEDAIIDRFKQISRAVFVGNGVASLIQGALVGLGFWMFDVGPAVLFGAVSTVLAFLPIVGASLVFIPGVIVLAFTGPLWLAALFLAYNIVVSLIVEYWFKSRLIGGEDMNSVLAFLAIIAGIQLFGVMGLFYGPLIVTMFLTFIEIFQTRYRQMARMDAPIALMETAAPEHGSKDASRRFGGPAEATRPLSEDPEAKADAECPPKNAPPLPPDQSPA